jgi:hypothetical protein
VVRVLLERFDEKIETLWYRGSLESRIERVKKF